MRPVPAHPTGPVVTSPDEAVGADSKVASRAQELTEGLALKYRETRTDSIIFVYYARDLHRPFTTSGKRSPAAGGRSNDEI
jgi:hypothetical protein